MNVRNIISNKWFWAVCSAFLVITLIAGIAIYGYAVAMMAVCCIIGVVIFFYSFKHPSFLPDTPVYLYVYQFLLGALGCAMFVTAWFLSLINIGSAIGPLFFLLCVFHPASIYRTYIVWGVKWIR
ncbi:hypothetical protein H2Y54_01710 [Pectobacterium aroidearum]|uniref:hypothetical protein n=1 Tax=Pectobacterium aroidearum TaxID=1201031 RepID=UPI0015F0802F|nr:hypothetical protein [Pectobacterium aroidearum]MBA5235270.1 hypothetical protein [Pectobacterium aroidearum]